MKQSTQLFRDAGLHPKKSFGQNFLQDPRICQRIAELASDPPGGTVVELGAGLGALTEPLLSRASRVIAIERDRDLCPILRTTFADDIASGKLELIEGDAKQCDYRALLARGPAPRVLAGNLPYQLTGPLLELATGLADALDSVVFMVQNEVAERLTAPPSGDAYGALTVFVSAAFRVERALRVPPGAFFPRPSVDSAVVVLIPLRPSRAVETEKFRQAIRLAFAQRRKKLRNAWSSIANPVELQARAAKCGIDLDRRGETLSVEEFARFSESGEKSHAP